MKTGSRVCRLLFSCTLHSRHYNKVISIHWYLSTTIILNTNMYILWCTFFSLFDCLLLKYAIENFVRMIINRMQWSGFHINQDWATWRHLSVVFYINHDQYFLLSFRIAMVPTVRLLVGNYLHSKGTNVESSLIVGRIKYRMVEFILKPWI